MIALWPDGTWCREEEIEEMLSCCSDDYELLSFGDIAERLDLRWLLEELGEYM
tara:strand:+ start:606 stop:764 length:159 start_codon:yes stop_codon:yes gene_type:complete